MPSGYKVTEYQEQTILKCIDEGLSNSEIAERTGLRHDTIIKLRARRRQGNERTYSSNQTTGREIHHNKQDG